ELCGAENGWPVHWQAEGLGRGHGPDARIGSLGLTPDNPLARELGCSRTRFGQIDQRIETSCGEHGPRAPLPQSILWLSPPSLATRPATEPLRIKRQPGRSESGSRFRKM